MQPSIGLPNLQGQKILITGGLGFIGSNLARQCLKFGAKITIYDCLDPNSGGNIFNINDIKDSVEIIFSDILNFTDVSKHIVNKDILFNCAASTSHPFSMREPWINLDVNSRGVINLLEAARRFNNGIKFIQIGTSTQLGRLQFKPADETHPEFPTDIYSANKSVAEKYVLIYGSAYGMKVSVIRFPNVFGPRACINSSEFTFNNYFIGLALQNKNITVYNPGEQLRNVIYVDDAVEALVMASQNNNANHETFFAVSDNHYSISQIAESTANILGGKVVYIDWPQNRKSIEVGDAILSNAKIKNILGWIPKYDLEHGLVETKKFYLSNLEKYLR
jgi:UDP-glucose 4-epimerase